LNDIFFQIFLRFSEFLFDKNFALIYNKNESQILLGGKMLAADTMHALETQAVRPPAGLKGGFSMKKTLVSALSAALVIGAASTTFAAANPFS